MPIVTTLILLTTASVVVAIFAIMWRERTSPQEARTAIVSGVVLAAGAVVMTVLAYRDAFGPPEKGIPPIAIALVVDLVVMAACLAAFPTLRRLLTRQENLFPLHLWRLLGILFLVLWLQGRASAVWALTAGIGDILVGATAIWIARQVRTPQGRRRAIAWTLFGMADLVNAVALGTLASPGPTHILHWTPTTEVMTHFPMALVPAFLVPLAFMLHVVQLWQLLGWRWARPATERRSVSRAPAAPFGPGWQPAPAGRS